MKTMRVTPVIRRSKWFGAIALGLFLAKTAPAQYAATAFVTPPGATSCQLSGVSVSTQVGFNESYSGGGFFSYHAYAWSGSDAGVVDLTPASLSVAVATGISGSSIIGYGWGTNTHALLWNGTSGSYIDLNPTGYLDSDGACVSGGFQGGAAIPIGSFDWHAAMWSGSAASFVDLNPTGFEASGVDALSSDTQVGYVLVQNGNAYIPALWRGSSASFVNLSTGIGPGVVLGVSGTRQVGYEMDAGNDYHALLWQGTAASATEITPTGIVEAVAQAISDSSIVGWGFNSTTGGWHALAWYDYGASWIDLHQFMTGLASGGKSLVLTQSYAMGLDDAGDIVGYGVDTAGTRYALLWSPSSLTWIEPATLNVFRGVVISGSLGSLLYPDLKYLEVGSGPTLNQSEAPIQLILTGTSSSSSVSSLEFDLTCHADTPGLTQFVQLFDWSSNSYVVIDTRNASVTDSVTEVSAPNPNRFIQSGTGSVKARVSFKITGPTLHWPPNVYVDQSVWRERP